MVHVSKQEPKESGALELELDELFCTKNDIRSPLAINWFLLKDQSLAKRDDHAPLTPNPPLLPLVAAPDCRNASNVRANAIGLEQRSRITRGEVAQLPSSYLDLRSIFMVRQP